jgi:formate--tetrahydrofolate ligase
MATRMALKFADYVVTEAGFGADLGAEKFLDIKCRIGGLVPSAVVIVATVRALKHHGGALKANLGTEDLDALSKGIPNLLKHIENITLKFGLPAVVAINRFPTDTEAELKLVEVKCKEYGANVALSEVWGKGGDGGIDLANEVVRLIDEGKADFKYIYPDNMSLKDKINAIVCNVYGGDGVDFAPAATKELAKLEEMGFANLPICMAKTQYSLSDDAQKLGWPKGFRVAVRNAKVSAGAGFVVVLTGDIMTMPGLPKLPAAEKIDVDSTGKISGLF